MELEYCRGQQVHSSSFLAPEMHTTKMSITMAQKMMADIVTSFGVQTTCRSDPCFPITYESISDCDKMPDIARTRID
jgi:hypothetical protein